MAHILLIEPDRVLAQIYRRALLAAGHTVRVCASAQAAISAADDMRPDLVILELQLVAHSGVEFLYEFRSYADWQRVPLLVLTMVPLREFAGSQQQLTGELGVGAYLYKPRTSLQKLCQQVARLLQQPAAS